MLVLTLLACSDGGGPSGACTEDPVERWLDADADGFGAGDPERVCADTEGYSDSPLDCDDADPDVHPEAVETCNGRDDDCNGRLDDGFEGVLYYTDADGDGFGVRYPAQMACADPGPGWTKNAEDCDDTRDDVNPRRREICNGGLDDDCNSVADDNDDGVDPATVPRWFEDADADGFGNPSVSVDRCVGQSGFVVDGTDCDDASAIVSPAADEIPGDGIDENCNAMEGCFEDLDHDGARTENWAEYADGRCIQPGHAPASFPLDCDDTDPLLSVDVGWYEDLDGDGYGSGDVVVVQCTDPGGDLVQESEVLDCDDDDPVHGPQTLEICDDGLDQNCDLRIDCDDQDCIGAPGCQLPCVDETLDPGTLEAQGSTVGAGDDSQPSCTNGSSPDMAFQFTVPETRMWTADTQGSNYDTTLYVRRGCVLQDIICNDDSIFGLQSQVQFQATEGEVVVIVVDGYGAGSSGRFQLHVY